MTVPGLVAHRGDAACFPENTLLSLEKALQSGAAYIEFDVQFCLDGTPVVFHDPSLERTCGLKMDLLALPYQKIKTIQASERARFGEQFINMEVGIPTLEAVVKLLADWPDVHVFVDVKKESLEKFGIAPVINKVRQVIKPILKQCSLVSKSVEALHFSRSIDVPRIGWILEEWSESSHSQAKEMLPDYLFCNHRKIPGPPTRLWSGPWFWGIYEIMDPEQALRLHNRGADLIITKDIGKMIVHPLLIPSSASRERLR